MKRRKRLTLAHKGLGLLLLVLFAVYSAGCNGNGDDGGSDGDGNEAAIEEQVDTSAEYVEVTDPEQEEALIEDMWQVLTSPSCWDASFVTDPIFTGEHTGSVLQLSFSGNYQYRYVGVMDTYFGTIYLHGVGHYRGYMTAIVETWSGDTEAIIIIDQTHIAHVIKHIDGSPIVTEYGASNGACL